MPGITIIGDSRNAARNRPTSLPAEARSLSRMLRLLKSSETAANALNQSLETLPLPSDVGQAAALGRVRQQVSQSVHDMREAGWDTLADRYAEYNMALAVESVLQNASSFVPTNSSSSSRFTSNQKNANQKQPAARNIPAAVAFPEAADDSSSTDASSVLPSKEHGFDNNLSLSPLSKDSNNGRRQALKTTHQTVAARRLPLVSDSSTVEASETCEEEEEETRVAGGVDAETNVQEEGEMGLTRAARYLWSIILESLHLQVASRTTRVWGRKKIYEVYQLARPMQDTMASAKELLPLRRRLEMECRSIFDGVLSDASDCRVYLTLQPLLAGSSDPNVNNAQALHVQINLGKIMDLQDERNRSVSGEKKKKAEREFVALLVPGSSLFALTASRSPSRSRYTPYILTVLENILTETTNNYAALKTAKKVELNDLAVSRYGDLSGTEPQDLLRAARSMCEGEAVGRFALMAEKDQSNPIADLHTASTANLLGPTNTSERKRVEVGTAQPGNPKVAAAAAKIAAESQGAAALVASDRNGDNLWVDHTVNLQESRKRAREEALGRPKDCPSLQRMCWKWAGETTAASACWLDGDGAGDDRFEGLPKTEFKCAVVMKGENVMQGFQALMDAGLVDGPLPDFLQDAPSMGGTIRVNHGAFAATDAHFEAV